MTWERPTLEEIQDRVKADIVSYATDGVPLPWVKLLGILGHAFSGASHLQFGFLEWLKKEMFILTAGDWGLTVRGAQYGLPRKAATYSSGYLQPTGLTGETIPDETIWVNQDGYEFEQQGSYTIDTDVEVEVVAVEAGAYSNTDDGYLTLSSPIADVDSTAYVLDELDDGTVPPQLDDGADLEGIEAWRLRLLQRRQNPPRSGNAEDYVRWALEVPGVGRAWCMPAEQWGLGSLGVFVSTYDLQAVTAGVLEAVETYVEEQRPCPAYVEYYNINPVNIIYNIAISPNTEEIQEAIEENLEELHLLEAEPGGTMLISHIRHAIKTAGVDDYEITDIAVVGYGFVDPIGDFSVTYPDTPVYYGSFFDTL